MAWGSTYDHRTLHALIAGILGAVVSITCSPASVSADMPSSEAPAEIRDFAILVDGKERGKSQMSISRRDDGSEVWSGSAEVRVKYLVYTYNYSSNATETWKNGRLLQLENNANYGGKEYVVNAKAQGNALSVRVNGQERSAPPDVWVTSYWRLPDEKFRNQPIALINGDTGRDIRGTLEFVGMEQVTIMGRAQRAAHYRVAGGVKVDLWYDTQERLLRQESMESGHKTVLEMSRIRR